MTYKPDLETVPLLPLPTDTTITDFQLVYVHTQPEPVLTVSAQHNYGERHLPHFKNGISDS